MWVVLAVLVLLAFGGLKSKGKIGSAVEYPYLAEKPLFTSAERSFLGVLDQAVGSDYRIFGKVRVADVLSVKKGGGKAAFFRISAKHFDFLLCRPDDLRPVCAIELNDQSHQQKDRQGRDDFLTEACKAAGLPLLWIPAQRTYTASSVFALVREALPSLALGTPPQPAIAVQQATVSAGSESQAQAAQVPRDIPSCPKCASPMVKRVVKTGAKQGSEFWGCSNFPECRGIIPI